MSRRTAVSRGAAVVDELRRPSCDRRPSRIHADHEAIPQSTGRPVGCSAALPYENPYYEGEQQTCLCMDLGGIKWVCAL